MNNGMVKSSPFAAKKEYLDYQAACAEWDKTYGDKAAAPTSIKEWLIW